MAPNGLQRATEFPEEPRTRELLPFDFDCSGCIDCDDKISELVLRANGSPGMLPGIFVAMPRVALSTERFLPVDFHYSRHGFLPTFVNARRLSATKPSGNFLQPAYFDAGIVTSDPLHRDQCGGSLRFPDARDLVAIEQTPKQYKAIQLAGCLTFVVNCAALFAVPPSPLSLTIMISGLVSGVMAVPTTTARPASAGLSASRFVTFSQHL